MAVTQTLTRRTPVRKRLLDVVVTSIALFLLAPVFAIVGVVILIDSRGPLLHRARRVGKDGRPFTFLKFRTMLRDAEHRLADLASLNTGGPYMIRIPNDPRVTRVGRWLRRHSIDELPQLINVLRGDMSLVGPRPQAPNEVARYSERQRRRLEVLPGITGLWQVTARESTDFDEWVRLDLEYIDNWSFWLDLKICLRTIPMLLFGFKAAESQPTQSEPSETPSPGC